MSPIFFQVILQNHSKIDTQIEYAMADLFDLFHQPIPNFNRIRHEQEWMEEEITSLTFPDGRGGSVFYHKSMKNYLNGAKNIPILILKSMDMALDRYCSFEEKFMKLLKLEFFQTKKRIIEKKIW